MHPRHVEDAEPGGMLMMMESITDNTGNPHRSSSQDDSDNDHDQRAPSQVHSQVDQKLLAFNNALKSFGTDMKTQFNNICEEIVQLNSKNDQLQEKCNDLTQNQEQLNENQEVLTSEVRESSTSQEMLNKNMSILYQNITDVRKFQYDAQDEIKVIQDQIKNMTLTITQTSKGLDFTNKKLDSVAKDVQYLTSGIVKTRAIPPRRQGTQGLRESSTSKLRS